MTKKVLITGASGFVGFHLIAEALRLKFDVYAAVRSDSSLKHLEDLPIHYVNLNYISVDALKIELEEKKYEYIIHAAGTTKAKSKAEYNKINAEFTRNLGLAANDVSYKIEKFIFVSSLAALGPLEHLSGQIEDNSSAHPITNYGKSKLLAEKYLTEINGLPLIVIRPTAVYGPREKDILILIKTVNRGIEPYIGKFNQQLSFIYVKDLAEIIIKALTSTIFNGNYNVSDGWVYTRYDLATYTKSLLKKKTLKFHLPLAAVRSVACLTDFLYTRSNKIPTLNIEKISELIAVNWSCSIKNLKNDFCYEPKFDLKSGLEETLEWYKANNWF